MNARNLPTDFDERIYLERNPDVAAAVHDRIWYSGASHFLSWGRREGRDYALPLPVDFDETAYLQSHPDAAASVEAGRSESGAAHWRVHGRREGRRDWSRVPWDDLPTAFDEDDYLALNPDVGAAIAAGAFDCGASHYKARGRAAGRDIAVRRTFASGGEPAGATTTQRPTARFGEAIDAAAYARRNPDLSATDLAAGAHAHWLRAGARDGLCPYGFRPYAARRVTSAFWRRRDAVTLYGFCDTPDDRGATAHSIRAALEATGRLHGIVTLHAAAGLETAPDVRAPIDADGAPDGIKVNLFVLDADMTHRFFHDGRLHLLDDSFNIAVWACDAGPVPPEWASAFGAFDEIWVARTAARDALATISPVPIVAMPLVAAPEPFLRDAVAGRLAALRLFDEPANDTATFAPGRLSATRCFDADGPRISVVVPVFDIDCAILRKCIASALGQTYRNWELVLLDDGSSRPDTLRELARHRGTDHRIKVALGGPNRGIAEATNAAIALASGEFIAFLDDDDELAPDALATMAAAIAADPAADLLYSDEDKIDPDGRLCDHYYKPDWSPEHLESCAYLLHLTVMRRATILAVGGLRSAFDGAQDFDLALRVSRAARRIVHVPEILYHWRKSPGSAAARVDAKPAALQRAGAALQDHLDACGRAASVAPGLAPGLFRVRDAIAPGTPVTLAILTGNRAKTIAGRGHITLVDHFVRSILERTEGVCAPRLLVVDDHDSSPAQRRRIEAAGGRIVSYTNTRPRFNIADKMNFAVAQVTTDLFVLLNDDMEVIAPGWLDALVELAQRPTSGVVGARLLYPNDRIQHCGMVFGIKDRVGHVFHHLDAEVIGYNCYTHVIRNYLAVTGACMAMRKSLFDEIGGFDTRFAVDFNDADFCLRAHAAGYRNIYTPFATLYHFEGATATRSAPDAAESAAFAAQWPGAIARDPYYNPNLTRLRHDCSPAP